MARGGEFAADVSRRTQCTAFAASFALSVMKTRPAEVAAHSVPVFCEARVSQATAPPARVPHAAFWRSVEGTPSPIRTKSPHPGWVADVVNSWQFASRYAWSPPQSCVRQTENEP